MPRARNRFFRCQQALAWMETNWPNGRSAELVWKDILIDYETGKPDPEIEGQTYREGASIVIELKKKRCPTCLMATLRHEYGHAKLWGHAKVERHVAHHPPHFWTLIGEIEDLWNEIGWEEANDYEVD